MVRIYRLHTYPDFPCDFPHTDFADDLKKLFEIRTDREQFNTFINNHCAEYLHNMIDSHQPMLRVFLAFNPQYHRGKERYESTFRRYFDELGERKRARKAEQERLARATNGHTETEQ